MDASRAFASLSLETLRPIALRVTLPQYNPRVSAISLASFVSRQIQAVSFSMKMLTIVYTLFEDCSTNNPLCIAANWQIEITHSSHFVPVIPPSLLLFHRVECVYDEIANDQYTFNEQNPEFDASVHEQRTQGVLLKGVAPWNKGSARLPCIHTRALIFVFKVRRRPRSIVVA